MDGAVMFEVLSQGVFIETRGPVYGMQDRGVSPGGAMDRFSYETGNILLENSPNSPALEMIVPPRLRFTKEAMIVFTGAGFRDITLKGDKVRRVDHGCVARACAGDILEIGQKEYGFRAYLCYKIVDDNDLNHAEGRCRGDFKRMAHWPDPQGFIRVVDGPERSILDNPDDFFNQHFMIDYDSNAMGLRLRGKGPAMVARCAKSMISGPVSDGTVQLTPQGPVVLLRHRQTLGGYPRIFNVISTDVDLLAQYAPGEHFRFRHVSMEEALNSMKCWKADLERLKTNLAHPNNKR